MSNDIVRDYEFASEIIAGMLTDKIVKNDTVYPIWIENSSSFWYKKNTEIGTEYRLVNANDKTNIIAFDHEKFATSLRKASKNKVDLNNLPISQVEISLCPLKISFHAFGKDWIYFANNNTCTAVDVKRSQGGLIDFAVELTGLSLNHKSNKKFELNSPDNNFQAFNKEYNLWLRDTLTGEEYSLTRDGTEDHCYASALWGVDDAVQATWSPDSKFIFTHKLDLRHLEERFKVSYVPANGNFSPQNISMPYSPPGAEVIPTLTFYIINIETGESKKLTDRPVPDYTIGDIMPGYFTIEFGWWANDSKKVYFIDSARDYKSIEVFEYDIDTCKIRCVLKEWSDTYIALRHEAYGIPNIKPVRKTNELVWFSERTGWAHLYLYDLEHGELKHAITSGEWLVRRILHFDENTREMYIQTSGRDSSISPYYQDVCKVNIDNGQLTTLVKGNCEHTVHLPFDLAPYSLVQFGQQSSGIQGVSPNGKYIVVTKSRVDNLPVTSLIDTAGNELLELEKADGSCIPNTWSWPEPIVVNSSEHNFDIHGVIFRPPNFDPSLKYPVIDMHWSTRAVNGLPQGSFSNAAVASNSYYFPLALSALGFVVVMFDGRGSPARCREFSHWNYGDPSMMSDLEDRVSGIKQLSSRFPFFDIDSVGLFAPEHSPAAVHGILHFPDFYKVAVQHCFLDPRTGISYIDEPYFGMINDGAFEDSRHAEFHVDKLKGKLLLIFGMLGESVGSFRLIDAFQKANKNFDMLCLPNLFHAMNGYTTKRGWDYLVFHLKNSNPPENIEVKMFYE